MGTLTYPDGDEWRGCKRHWHALVARLARLAARNGKRAEWSVCWFLEFQRNGRPHIHFFTNLWLEREWLAKAWAEIVGSDDARHRSAGTRIEWLRKGRGGTISYARKYAAKLDQKVLPSLLADSGFGRWWGISGSRKVVAATTRVSQDDLSDENVQIAIERLDNAIESQVSIGRARALHFEHCDVVVFKDRLAEAIVREAFDGLAREVERCRLSATTSRIAANDERWDRRTPHA